VSDVRDSLRPAEVAGRTPILLLIAHMDSIADPALQLVWRAGTVVDLAKKPVALAKMVVAAA
jgi:hypothetical protein